MKSEHDELVRVAAHAARAALTGWSPEAPDSIDKLALAIGEAVAAGLVNHEEISARLTASRMEDITAAEDMHNWQI